MLKPEHYQTAIDVQSACNLSGVVFSFAEIMKEICEENIYTKEKNLHSICRLFSEQIQHLTSSKDYFEAYNECKKMAITQEVTDHG